VLEGYVDLLVRTDRGLVIVDYKTDQWSGTVQAEERIARYRIQLAAYGVALERALGERVCGGVLIRCRPDAPADEIEIERWEEALDDVRALVS
jgi:ATP-dependent helicase/nuclease subunit A